MSTINHLTKESVSKSLLKFALPYLFASFMQALYGGVDLMCVGNYSGNSAISAVAGGSQIMLLITSFVIGITMGVTVILNKFVGKEDYHSLRKCIGTTTVLFLIFALFVTPIMFMLSKPLASIMLTPKEALNEIIKYVRICSLGLPFIVAFNVVAAIYRGLGNSKIPMKFVGIACIINILGDLLLVGTFKLGVVGAAIATISAQGIASIVGVISLIKENSNLNIDKTCFKIDKNLAFNIIKIGMPIALQDLLINFSFIAITIIANSRGLDFSSAVGVVEKIIHFLFLVPSAIMSSVSAVSAQSIGNNDKDRAYKSVKYGIVVDLVFGVVVFMLCLFIPETLIRLFTSDSKVIILAKGYLYTYSTDVAMAGLVFPINGYLCADNKSMIFFIHNMISAFLFRIPLAYLFSILYTDSLFQMGLASPIGSLVSLIFLILYFIIKNK